MQTLKNAIVLIINAIAALFVMWLNSEQDEYDRRKGE